MDSNEMREKLNMYNNFRKVWSLNRVQNLTLEEYTNSNDNSFIYDVEFGTRELGSIKGRSAFIFGIYKREDLTKQGNYKQYLYGKEYGWLSKFGNNEQEAFNNVKNAVIEVIINAQNGNYSAIDANPLDSMYKWKIAYLYQNKDDISITPVFTRAALELYAKKIGEYEDNIPMSNLYLMIKSNENYQNLSDAIKVGKIIWDKYSDFGFKIARDIINNNPTLSENKRRNATQKIELVEYEIKVLVQRHNLHNKLEKSFNKYLKNIAQVQNIVQDENYIDFHFDFNNQKCICELKPSSNQKEINYAIQNAVGQILRYSYNRDFDIKIIVFQNEPNNENLKFLDYLKNKHNIYYLYEVKNALFKGNCLNL